MCVIYPVTTTLDPPLHLCRSLIKNLLSLVHPSNQPKLHDVTTLGPNINVKFDVSWLIWLPLFGTSTLMPYTVWLDLNYAPKIIKLTYPKDSRKISDAHILCLQGDAFRLWIKYRHADDSSSWFFFWLVAPWQALCWNVDLGRWGRLSRPTSEREPSLLGTECKCVKTKMGKRRLKPISYLIR